MPPHFSLAVVSTRDGLIARSPDHPPQAWASAEEQALFFAHIDAADWAIMGRNTHLAADRPDRHRIILSRSGGTGDWRRPTQLWLDPATTTPRALGAAVATVKPLKSGLILGGTGVHGWFHDHRAIDRVFLTIEPVTFGSGLPIFPGDPPGDPLAAFTARGYAVVADEHLNAAGTRYLTLAPEPTP